MSRASLFVILIWSVSSSSATPSVNERPASTSATPSVNDEVCANLVSTGHFSGNVTAESAITIECYCRIFNLTYAQSLAQHDPNPFNGQGFESLDSQGFWTFFCSGPSVCPSPMAPDIKEECTEDAHKFRSTFRSLTTQRNSLQWEVFFLIFWVLMGAFFRRFSPSWVPYTVGILVIGVTLGAIAEVVEQNPKCPHNIFLYDSDGDNRVSRAEYDRYLCVGCNPDSFCLTAQHTGEWGFGKRTCGDGTADAPDCPSYMDFDSLDGPWKKSEMLPEKVISTQGKGAQGNGYLEPDELWRRDCNSLKDILLLSDIDPHYLLVIFLPALLFESATFGLDIGIFKKQKFQILLMAFPAMILASALTGALLYAHSEVIESGWTFWHCWLVGIINSATDPVAVVALLKDLGASKNLGCLIEGESLLNDGSAVVLFTWVRNVIGYDHSTIGPSWMFSARDDNSEHDRYDGLIGVEFVRVVAQMLLLGVALGLIAGKVTCFMLRRVYEDAVVETSLLIGISYLAFWLGELVMGTAAIVVVVIQGLCVNASKGSISPSSLHVVHSFYEMVAHFLNTLIFAIAGVKLGVILGGGTFFLISESWYWLIIYPICLFARGAAILLFFPLLSRLGTKATWQEAVVMWWGGLRGSVGLALALTLSHTTWSHDMWGGSRTWTTDGSGFLPCHDVPATGLVMTCMMILLTVVVNGMTMAPLMRVLGLTATPEDRRFAVRKAMVTITNKTNKLVDELKKDGIHDAADWGSIDSILLQNSDTVEKLTRQKDENVGHDAWLHMLQMERASYLAQYEDGIMLSAAYNAVEEMMANLMATASAIDATTPDVCEQISKEYDQHLESFLASLSKTKPFVRQDQSVAVAWDAAVAYKRAMHDVGHHLSNDEAYKNALKEHDAIIQRIEAFLAELQREHPDLVKNLATHHAAKTLLRHQCAKLRHLQHEGALMDLDVNKLMHEPMVLLRKLDALSGTQSVSAVKPGVTKSKAKDAIVPAITASTADVGVSLRQGATDEEAANSSVPGEEKLS